LPELRAGDAVGATLTRDGVTSALVASQALQAGDTVTTAETGAATLVLGDDIARLASATQLRILVADDRTVELDQTEARAWHRVGGAMPSYRVHTGGLPWTADGTAFDIRVDPVSTNAERWVTAIGIEHDVAIAGPDLSATLLEGGLAHIRIDGDHGPLSDVELGRVDDETLRDPWLRENA